MSAEGTEKDEVDQIGHSERSPLVGKISKNAKMSRGVYTVENEESSSPATDTTPQYLAAIIVTVGGFVMGTTLGWTSPAGPMLEDGQRGFPVTEDGVSWIASCVPLGALLGCPVAAGLVDALGRRNLMAALTLPAFVGWLTIIQADSVAWICAGRVLTGFASGACSVVVPLYTSEIADKEIRGKLGSYFQLQVFSGILFAYVTGSCFKIFGLSVACAAIPVVYFCLLMLIPESPIYYLMKRNFGEARSSLRFLRGSRGQIDTELNDMHQYLAKTERESVSIARAFQTTPAKRGLLLGLGVMVFQQFTGCNAVIFYAATIFDATGSTIGSNTSSIIVGVMAVSATYYSTLVVDKLGRRILLLYSIVFMGTSTLLIGAFFFAKDFHYNVSSVGFIPLLSLCTFVILFSIGFGPIPWMLMGEIFPPQIKGIASSIVCMSNWFFVFLVTKLFATLVSVIHLYNTFFLYTLFSVLGTFFVVFLFPETKGKTMEEIQKLLGADSTVVSLEKRENENQIR